MLGLEIAVQLVQTLNSMTHCLQRLALGAAVAVLAAACVPFPETRPGAPPLPEEHPAGKPADIAPAAPNRYSYREGAYVRGPEEVSGPAVLKLLDQARGELNAGRAEQAVAELETALNIEPQNPFIWQQMARAHLLQHLPDQAEHKAQRSNSFARGNPYIEVENWRVIAIARQERGDLSGARQAQDRIAELQGQLPH